MLKYNTKAKIVKEAETLQGNKVSSLFYRFWFWLIIFSWYKADAKNNT